MARLAEMSSAGVTPGTPPLSAEAIAQYRSQIPDWQIVERDGVQRIERVFTFPDFANALDFTDRVGALAERQGHHPAIMTEWGKVTVAWWTHMVGGLHLNDLILAAKTDVLARAS